MRLTSRAAGVAAPAAHRAQAEAVGAGYSYAPGPAEGASAAAALAGPGGTRTRTPRLPAASAAEAVCGIVASGMAVTGWRMLNGAWVGMGARRIAAAAGAEAGASCEEVV